MSKCVTNCVSRSLFTINNFNKLDKVDSHTDNQQTFCMYQKILNENIILSIESLILYFSIVC